MYDDRNIQLEDVLGRQNYMSQHEVAEVMGLSRSQVDTIEKKALRKLRILLRRKNFNKEDLF